MRAGSCAGEPASASGRRRLELLERRTRVLGEPLQARQRVATAGEPDAEPPAHPVREVERLPVREDAHREQALEARTAHYSGSLGAGDAGDRQVERGSDPTGGLGELADRAGRARPRRRCRGRRGGARAVAPSRPGWKRRSRLDTRRRRRADGFAGDRAAQVAQRVDAALLIADRLDAVEFDEPSVSAAGARPAASAARSDAGALSSQALREYLEQCRRRRAEVAHSSMRELHLVHQLAVAERYDCDRRHR